MFETSKYNITYYLGAGASAHALPTIRKTEYSESLANELLNMAKQLEELEFENTYKEYVIKLISNLKWLSERSDEFGTPDTYAKFLSLKGKGRLLDLKNTLSAFFLFEQFLNNKFDKRALIFLVTILERNIFPGNIKIINWNYDFQIQLAAENFCEERFTYSGFTSVYSPALIGYYPTLGLEMQHDSKEISMVHLNGIAGCYYDSNVRMYKSFFERKEERDINHVLKSLSDLTHINNNLLSFAWEPLSKSIEFAKEIVLNTDILVIIGYSFPFFNRKIDKEVFDALKKSNRLKTIYYQDPIRTGEFLRNQFELSDDIVIKNVKETENYFVPLEL